MTTRRWMVAVAVVAILIAVSIRIETSRRLLKHYGSAIRRFQAGCVYYIEGRLTLEHCIERSRSVMEAELALCATKEEQVAAIKAHLDRASSLIEAEINWPESLHYTAYERAPFIAEAKGSLLDCEARLHKLTGAP